MENLFAWELSYRWKEPETALSGVLRSLVCHLLVPQTASSLDRKLQRKTNKVLAVKPASETGLVPVGKLQAVRSFESLEIIRIAQQQAKLVHGTIRLYQSE